MEIVFQCLLRVLPACLAAAQAAGESSYSVHSPGAAPSRSRAKVKARGSRFSTHNSYTKTTS